MTSQLDFESYYNKLFEKWSWNVSAYGAYKKIQIELHEGRLKQNDLSQFMEAFEIVFGRKGADDVRSMLKNRNSRPTLSLVGKVRGGSPVLMYTDTDNTSYLRSPDGSEDDALFRQGDITKANIVDEAALVKEPPAPLKLIRTFYTEVRLQVCMSPLSWRSHEVGDTISLEEFMSSSLFSDEDGYGYLCNTTHYWAEKVSPSQLKFQGFDQLGAFTHIIWIKK